MRRLSFELLPNHTTELPGLRRGQIALLGFRVGVHHVEGLVASCPVIDDSQPGALAGTGGGPPDFTQPPGPLNDRPLLPGAASTRSVAGDTARRRDVAELRS